MKTNSSQTIRSSKGGTSNLLRHLQDVHPVMFKALETDSKKIKADLKLNSSKQSSVSSLVQQSIFDASNTTAVITAKQLNREFVAWIVNSNRPDNLALDIGFRRFTALISGGVFLPPTKQTIKQIELTFEKELRDNINKELIEAGILNSQGTGPMLNAVPTASLGFDGSTTTIEGIKSFSLNLYYLKPESTRSSKICLGVNAFESAVVVPDIESDNEENDDDHNGNDDISVKFRATAKNIGLFIIKILKSFYLIPEDFEEDSNDGVLDISEYFFSAGTDNAAAEVCAVVKILKLLKSPCQCHSADLVIKDAMKGTDLLEVVEILGKVAVHISVLLVLFATNNQSIFSGKAAKRDKKGEGKSALLKRQKDDGVLTTLSLISMAKTRWHIVFDMCMRAILLKKYMCSHLVEDLEFIAIAKVQWIIIQQSAILLFQLKVFTKKMETRGLINGESFPWLFKIINSLVNPSSLRFLPDHDFVPTVENLNSASIRGKLAEGK